jgi:hypothetical protein
MPKLDGKLFGALCSWHVTTYTSTIFRVWRATGFVMLTIKD